MHRTRRILLAAAALVALSAALAGAAVARQSSSVSPETTGIPGTFAIINVKLSEKGVTVSRHSSSSVQVIGFRIRNLGKKSHNFIIGTHATNAIKPGQFDDFAVAFNDFGSYSYKCTLNCPKSAHGTILVKRGNFNDAAG
jgi:plastocyanin